MRLITKLYFILLNVIEYQLRAIHLIVNFHYREETMLAILWLWTTRSLIFIYCLVG